MASAKRKGASRAKRPDRMKTGAVGIIDALGFKGMWKKRDVADLLATLRAIKGAARSDAGYLNELVSQGIDVRCVFFSDSVIITAKRKSPDVEISDGELVAHVGVMVQGAIAGGLSGSHRIVYRGCIGFGEIEVQEEFLVGPAIDETAEWCERANAAVVWLLPSSRNVFIPGVQPPEFFECEVPIKGDGTHRAWVVDPYGRIDLGQIPGLHVGLRPSPRELRARMLAYFGDDRVDVLIKKEATERLLDAADENHRRRIAGTTAADGSINK